MESWPNTPRREYELVLSAVIAGASRQVVGDYPFRAGIATRHGGRLAKNCPVTGRTRFRQSAIVPQSVSTRELGACGQEFVNNPVRKYSSYFSLGGGSFTRCRKISECSALRESPCARSPPAKTPAWKLSHARRSAEKGNLAKNRFGAPCGHRSFVDGGSRGRTGLQTASNQQGPARSPRRHTGGLLAAYSSRAQDRKA